MPKILLTYATRYGSTQEVAEAVAAVLRDRGLSVDVRPARDVRSVDEYDAVVVGAPLYIGSLLKDATRLLQQHAPALAQRLVAVFALGPVMGGSEAELEGARDQLKQVLAKIPGLKPPLVQVFGGKYDPAHLRLPDRLLGALPASPLHNLPAADLRDWAAIKAWAGEVADAISRR